MKTLVTSLFVALIAAAFAYQLNKKTADVRYTLSERIPVTFTSQDEVPSESVQRLEVRNIGNEEARQVQVKLNARVTWFKLLKHSEQSTPAVFPSRVPFEIVYPSLPPDASFVIIFKSAGSVPNSAVSVRHSGGKAAEALAKPDSSWSGWLLWFTIIINLLVTGMNFRTDEQGRIDRRLAYKRLPALLEMRKPRFVNSEKWEASLRAALVQRVDQLSTSIDQLEQSEATLVLNLPRPSQVTQAAWAEILTTSAKTYESSLKHLIRSSWPSVEALYLLKKPEYLSDSVWRELQLEIRRRHIIDITPAVWDRPKVRALLLEPPEELEASELWPRFHAYLQSEYTRSLAERVINSHRPLEQLSEADLALLDNAQRREIVALAYEIHLAQYRRSIRLSDVEAILLMAKPEWLEEADFADLKRPAQMERDAQNAEAAAVEAGGALKREREEVVQLKRRIEWQLETIHRILSDPSAADRIEEYEDRFAPGNIANLKKLADMVRKSDWGGTG